MIKTMLAASVLALVGLSARAGAAAPALAQVQLSATAPKPLSGRLLIFAEPWDAAKAANKGADPTVVDANGFEPGEVAIAAAEIPRLAPGQTDVINADLLAYPTAFSALKPGVYAVQAVLDVGHTYGYAGREARDPVSPVVKVDLNAGGTIPVLTLTPTDEAPKPVDAANAARADVDPIDFVSPALSRFWGRPVHIRGWLVRPPGYGQGQARYPSVYWTAGFGGTLARLAKVAADFDDQMTAGQTPPMIYVILDQSSPTGTHEFADSVNNGPWGAALTGELIPDLERRYRMDARPSGRFLTGHSSGGWASLWLQVAYPALFGGAWATSPDSSDFHDFNGPDIYAPGANVYRRPDGAPWPLVRDHAKVLATFEDFARQERVLGDYGGQQASFDWVFSPKGPDGRPVQMFDRDTGAVDPAVAAYWRDHYDIAWRITHDWPALKPNLDGKIHLIVGTADTFYLDGAAHRLKAALDSVGARADVRFLADRTHFDLYAIGDDKRGLQKQMAWAMYAVARPDSPLQPKP